MSQGNKDCPGTESVSTGLGRVITNCCTRALNPSLWINLFLHLIPTARTPVTERTLEHESGVSGGSGIATTISLYFPLSNNQPKLLAH